MSCYISTFQRSCYTSTLKKNLVTFPYFIRLVMRSTHFKDLVTFPYLMSCYASTLQRSCYTSTLKNNLVTFSYFICLVTHPQMLLHIFYAPLMSHVFHSFPVSNASKQFTLKACWPVNTVPPIPRSNTKSVRRWLWASIYGLCWNKN